MPTTISAGPTPASRCLTSWSRRSSGTGRSPCVILFHGCLELGVNVRDGGGHPVPVRDERRPQRVRQKSVCGNAQSAGKGMHRFFFGVDVELEPIKRRISSVAGEEVLRGAKVGGLEGAKNSFGQYGPFRGQRSKERLGDVSRHSHQTLFGFVRAKRLMLVFVVIAQVNLADAF